MTEPDVFEVSGRPGEPVALPVGGGPATGHEWRLDLPAGVEQVADTAVPAGAPTEAGAPTGSRLQVVAPVGRHEITARLARPWESEAEAVRTVAILLTIS